MSERTRILDLGAGKGGDYIIQDQPHVMRVAADLRRDHIKKIARRYGSEAVALDAYLDQRIDVTTGRLAQLYLPFGSESFDGVQIRFPHNELLFGLTRPEDLLWEELNRILRDNSGVTVVFDVPPEGYRELRLKGHDIRVHNPESNIWQAALGHFSRVHIERLSVEEVFAMGTKYSKAIAGKMRKNEKHKTYCLEAFKE